MKVFQCDGCRNRVFFDNVQCVKCGRALGFLPSSGVLSALEPAGNGMWNALASGHNGGLYRQCVNGPTHQVCNWMLEAGAPGDFCASCRLNQMIPDMQTTGNRERWGHLESAKRRLVYTLLQLNLPTESTESHPALRFKFLGDVAGQAPTATGHSNGIITVNIAEADDDERERRRVSLHEHYRTLLGHLRHEVGHYYWDRLVSRGPWLVRFRALFGTEEQDYNSALMAYYQQGPMADWQARHVSAYASSHPWEDWAESWALYFHIIDTVETAASFGMNLKPEMVIPAETGRDASNFDSLLEYWFPLTYALNSLNRGMGLRDLYPFLLSEPVIEKLRFIHQVAHNY